MMYLIDTTIFEIAKRQYFLKLKANFGLFSSLVLVQILAIFFSLGGVSSSSTGGSGMNISIAYFSGNIVIAFTLIWAFVISTILKNSSNRNMDFTFVSNRLTSDFSNIGFLITLSLYGGITASLSSNLIRVLLYFISGSQNIISEGFFVSPQNMFMGIMVMVLYIILISSIGYLIGSLSQLSQVFIILFSVVPIGLIFGIKLFSSSLNSTSIDFIKKVFNFYFAEGSLIIFAVKTLITAAVLFATATLISNKLEVRK